MYNVLAIIVTAVVTYAVRAVPLCFFQKEIKSRWLRDFLYYIPYAVLGAMTFPAIFYSTGSTPAAVLGMIGAMVMAFFNMGLLPTAAAAAGLALICEFFI